MRKMKNIVFIKNINSNLIEEAIVVFKENVKIKENQAIKSLNSNKNVSKLDNNICVKEAEKVIEDYIRKIEDDGIELKLRKQIKKAKLINLILLLSMILILLVP